MELFGIYKSIEYIERQLNNVEYTNSKEDIRSYGSNSLILVENLLKELLHIYGYVLFGTQYKEHLSRVVDFNDKLMFGTTLNALVKLHTFLKDQHSKDRFYDLFKRNYVVFRYNDVYFDKLMDCSKNRAILLHDLVDNINTIDSYKLSTVNAIKKVLETLRYFREKNIFPDMIYLDNYYISDNTAVCHFKDEIGSTIPIQISKYKIEEIKDKTWYIFKNSNKDLLIPTFNKLNHLIDENSKIDKEVILDLGNKDKTVMPLGYLLINKDERYPIISDNIKIGRLKENDLVFEGRSISRNHCIVKVLNNDIFILDDNSTFGTFVNGIKLDPNKNYRLNDKDEILIGIGVDEVKLKYNKY
ncbi:MAG: FHA domain-containing protein [Sedimentibacter sp.]